MTIANPRTIIATAILALSLSLTPLLARADGGEFTAGHLAFQIPAQWTAEGKKAKLSLIAPGEDAFIVMSLLQAGDENFLRAQAGQVLSQYLADLVLADSGQKIGIGAMPALRFAGSGSSDATAVSFVAVVVSPEKHPPVLVLAYTTQRNFPAAQPVFEAFLASLKPR